MQYRKSQKVIPVVLKGSIYLVSGMFFGAVIVYLVLGVVFGLVFHGK